ncbi:hypothetical protein Hanom_Chr05g00400671 [Helianthus anomalus]
MAGMLPGVESARRRRLRGSSGWSDPSSIVSSGLGFARIRLSNNTHLTPTSLLVRIMICLNLGGQNWCGCMSNIDFFVQQRAMVNQSDEDEKLGGAAREAKERLDGRLRGHLKQEIKRQNNQETTPVVMEDLHMEIYRSKKKLRWGKTWLRWKSLEQ